MSEKVVFTMRSDGLIYQPTVKTINALMLGLLMLKLTSLLKEWEWGNLGKMGVY